ncbi:MAG: LamG-like jellyroll fold domain-containing protein [Candidatus Solibacter sp.]
MRAKGLIFALLLGAGSSFAATLTHDYLLQNTLADSLGGPDLTSLGGTIGPTGYTFAQQQGLSLSNAFTGGQNANYSIYLNFAFDVTTGFRKILDFKALGSDNGLYNLDTTLNFYNITTGPAGAFAPGVFAQVVLTRDGSGNVVGYVNGVQQISFADTSSAAVFDAANGIINFFQDDGVTGGRESSGGVVTEIRIYDGALTAEEVGGLTAAPEPASLALAGAGLALCVLGRRKKLLG